MEPLYNELPRDWENVFLIMGIHYTRAVFLTFHYNSPKISEEGQLGSCKPISRINPGDVKESLRLYKKRHACDMHATVYNKLLWQVLCFVLLQAWRCCRRSKDTWTRKLEKVSCHAAFNLKSQSEECSLSLPMDMYMYLSSISPSMLLYKFINLWKHKEIFLFLKQIMVNCLVLHRLSHHESSGSQMVEPKLGTIFTRI